jgi:hypothetical protein
MGTWILLVLASILLIGYGIWRAGWHIRLPSPAEQQEVWTGSLFIYAGCALSLGVAVWSGARDNPVWVTICVGLPGALVGLARLQAPYDLKRFVAAVVAFPLALAGVAEVIWARGRRQRG